MVFFTRIVVLFVFQSENMEALNVLRILTAHHILSANMKNANVELVSSEMEERASLVRRLIPINNLRNSKEKIYVSFLGNKFSLAEKSWHSGWNGLCYYYTNTCLATPRETQCATQVKPCWTGLETVYRWPAGNQSRLDEPTFFSLLFSCFPFFIVLFDRKKAYWKAFLGIFRSPGGQKK